MRFSTANVRSSQLRNAATKFVATAALASTFAAVGAVATSHAADASIGNNTPVLLIHGFDGGGIFSGDLPLDSAVDCNNSVIAAWKQGLRNRGFTNVRTVGYYQGDTHCDLNVPNRSTITINTSTTTIARRLTNMISTSFGTQNVGISAHSYGGLIARRAIAGVQNAESGFSSTIRVSDVVTSGTPHGGANVAAICGTVVLFTQCAQAAPNSSYLADLEDNPQAVGGTDWTLIGSQCDETVTDESATDMSQRSTARPQVAKVVFGEPGFFDGGCTFGAAGYDHAELITRSAPLNSIRTGLTTTS